MSGEAGLKEWCETSVGMSLSARWSTQIGSVVLKREQVIVAVRGEVGWAQVGQQLIGVSQPWKQLGTKAKPDSSSGLRPATSSQSGPQGLSREVGGALPHQPPTQATPEPLSLLLTGPLPAKDCSATRNHLC